MKRTRPLATVALAFALAPGGLFAGDDSAPAPPTIATAQAQAALPPPQPPAPQPSTYATGQTPQQYAAPQAATYAVPQTQYQTATVQTILVTVPTVQAAAPAPLFVKQPGHVGRALAAWGERLQRHGMARVYVPAASSTVYAVQSPVQQVQYQVQSAPVTYTASPSPQAATQLIPLRKHAGLFHAF
jgi:hypothetical protein